MGSVAILLLPDFRYDLPLSPGLDERGRAQMISFKGTHFPQDIIRTGVRWYVAYPLSSRHVEALMAERSVSLTTPPFSAGSCNRARCWKTPCTGASGRCTFAGGWTRRPSKSRASGAISGSFS
jgi:hypothetical protein